MTQAPSVSPVTWKEHLSPEHMGESESPTPFAPIKHHPWHRSHSLCRKITSYPHLPTTMTGPFKEPLKLIKGGSAQKKSARPGHPTSDPAALEMEGRSGGPHTLWPIWAASPSPWQPEDLDGLEEGTGGEEL